MEALAEQLTTQQKPEFDQNLRVTTDTATWLAETLHGSMRNNFEFTYDGQYLRSEDGGVLDEVFDDAIAEARAMAEWNPALLFELRRRIIDRGELDDMYKMAKGELPNTMIVISDYPSELANAKEDVIGYNHERQQSMMRIITLNNEGIFNVTSQSLDGSNRQALEAIYEALNEPVEEGELLSQRIHRDLPENWQNNLTDNLTDTYDDSLKKQYGGEWHSGIRQRPDCNIINTYEFVLQQQDLISWFSQEKIKDPVGAEKLRYKLAATAKARYERSIMRQYSKEQPILSPVSYASFVSAQAIAGSRSLFSELERESNRAARKGMSFSGCGSTVNAENLDSESFTDGVLAKSGYGNKRDSKSNKSCEFTSKECPQCNKKNVKTVVTKNRITGDCGCSKTIKS